MKNKIISYLFLLSLLTTHQPSKPSAVVPVIIGAATAAVCCFLYHQYQEAHKYDCIKPSNPKVVDDAIHTVKEAAHDAKNTIHEATR